MTEKSVKVRVICLAVASVALFSSLTVSAFVGSPYEILKKALFKSAAARNATLETQMTLTVNGRTQQREKSFSVNADDSFLSYYFDRDGNPDGFIYYSDDGLRVCSENRYAADGEKWYRVYFTGGGSHAYSGGVIGLSERVGAAEMRFIELLSDMVVGDLKNNINMSGQGGLRHISGVLTESQAPELVKAGIDVLIEEQGRYNASDADYGDYIDYEPYEKPTKGLTINCVRGDADVDGEGNLRGVHINITVAHTNIFDEVSQIEVDFNAEFSDIGVSDPAGLVPFVRQLAPEYFKHFDSDGFYAEYYFTLNEDGSINENSINTRRP